MTQIRLFCPKRENPLSFEKKKGLSCECVLAERDQLLSDRIENCLGAVPGPHLSHDVGYVTCDSVVTNAKFARHLLVAVSGCD